MCLQTWFRLWLLSFLRSLAFVKGVFFWRLFQDGLFVNVMWVGCVIFCIKILIWKVVLNLKGMFQIATATLTLSLVLKWWRKTTTTFFAAFKKFFLDLCLKILAILHFRADRLADGCVVFRLARLWFLGCIFVKISFVGQGCCLAHVRHDVRFLCE